jgi:hypothetical protein
MTLYEVQAVYQSQRTLTVEVPAGMDPLDSDNWTVIDDDETDNSLVEVIDAVKMDINQVQRERDELRQRNVARESLAKAKAALKRHEEEGK